MFAYIPLTYSSGAELAVGVSLGVLAIAIALLRRLAMSGVAQLAVGLGLLVWILAAGGVVWQRPAAQDVAVMIDLSGSTRGAEYRDRATLEKRVKELLGPTPHRFIFFGAENRENIAGETLLDLPGDKTVFSPPPAGAVLLFSDGRFDLPPTGTPVYCIVDRKLEKANDASVTRMEIRGDEVAVRVNNALANDCDLTMTGVAGPTTRVSAGSSIVVTRKLENASGEVSARVEAADAWPENDRMWIRVPTPALSERWWVGAKAPAGWRAISADALPVDGTAYLAPSIIVLNNISANALSEVQQECLVQYVRDLGGALVIGGGDHAFSAGGYVGSRLENISCLTSVPPAPTTHWIVLGDSSGSMSTEVGSTTRWELQRQAMLRVLPQLPADDPVSLGTFAEGLNWWSTGKSARETATLALPPPGAAPSGPTNLDPALNKLVDSLDVAMPKELLLITDAETKIENTDELIRGFAAKRMRLHVLAVGRGEGLAKLREISQKTGGQVMEELRPTEWRSAIERLAQAAAPDRLKKTEADVRFIGAANMFPPERVQPWNRTWLKKNAELLADTKENTETIAMAGRWHFGSGVVASCAFDVTTLDPSALDHLFGRPPRDPRFVVEWDSGGRLRVHIRASDEKGYLNSQKLELEIRTEGDTSKPTRLALDQTAPGEYEVSVDAPHRATVATIWSADRIIDRHALAGRYPAEFDAIGNDRDALNELARRTGGSVIEPDRTKPIDFHWPPREMDLRTWFSIAGAVFVALGLAWWRIMG